MVIDAYCNAERFFLGTQDRMTFYIVTGIVVTQLTRRLNEKGDATRSNRRSKVTSLITESLPMQSWKCPPRDLGQTHCDSEMSH